MRTLSAVVLVGILSAVSGLALARQADPLSPVSGAILQADGPAAGRLLGAIDVGALSDEGRRQYACMVGRLDPATPLTALAEEASFSDRALHAYRTYWREAIASPDDRSAAEARLKARLAVLLDRPETADLESLMIERIRSEGRFALAGKTGRLLELMLWSKQEEREFTVVLPEGSHTNSVFMLDGFESQGWSNWMTCDRTGTGGWTKPEGLYAIVPAYGSFDDEDFAVNFLAHETQHFSDNASWTGMPVWQLEYRAKLAELALARETRAAVLARFSNNQSDDPAEPHSYANRLVLVDLRQRLGLSAGNDLGAVAAPTLNRAARALLLADTARRPTPLTR